MKSAKTIAEFSEFHNIQIPPFLKDDEKAIFWLDAVERSINTSTARHSARLLSEGDPSWAMLQTMVGRVQEHAAASVVAYFTGGWAAMEVIVRTTIEAGVTVLYITSSDRDLRLGQYLTHYFSRARKAVEKSEISVREETLKILETREDFIRQVTDHEGIPFNIPGWPPNVLELFKAVGRETEYRHLYAVLSIEVHNDASSLVDFVITKCLSHLDTLHEARAGIEIQFWMRFYMYSGLRYYALAAHSYAVALQFPEAIAETRRVAEELYLHTQQLEKDFSEQNKDTKRLPRIG